MRVLESECSRSSVAGVAREGLLRMPRSLPPWLFYDEAGSRLFEGITRLEEYYLTRIEREILAMHAGEILELAAAGRRLRITELGAGSSDKTLVLLESLVSRQPLTIYEPVDVSPSALEGGKRTLEALLPGVIAVSPVVGDYSRELVLAQGLPDERRLVLFIGSSIGNYEPEESAALLRRVRSQLVAGDSLLLGVDCAPVLHPQAGEKSEAALLAAYNDAAGVTAEFNRNVLVRLNRELSADFQPERFRHRAWWNESLSRIEMHLVSEGEQKVWIPALSMRLDFCDGESIHTENSYKFHEGEAEAMLSAAGFDPVRVWPDRERSAGAPWFSVLLGVAR